MSISAPAFLTTHIRVRGCKACPSCSRSLSISARSLTTFLAAIITSHSLCTLHGAYKATSLSTWGLHEVLHISIEKLDKFVNFYCNHNGLKLGLAMTNEAFVGLLFWALGKLPILWALHRPVFAPDVHVMNSTQLGNAVDAPWLHNCTATDDL